MKCDLSHPHQLPTAIILAGGKGTRLQAVVADRPKPLALVAGRPFIEYLFLQLREAGIRDVIISTGYLGNHFQSHLNPAYYSLALHYSHELSPLGTGGALRHALPLIASERAIVLNGDSFCSLNLCELIEFHTNKRASITLTTITVQDVSRYGSVTITDGGLVTDFIEKGIDTGKGLINAGVYVIEKSVINKIAPELMTSFEKDVMPHYLGHSLYAYPATGMFIDIGVPDDYKRAQRLFCPAVDDQEVM